MGRLIDADAFERSVMFGDAEDMQDVIYALRDFPTAYDPDKVVEQLEALTEEECTLHECGIRSEHCKACIAKKAIEIVKGGGMDDSQT